MLRIASLRAPRGNCLYYVYSSDGTMTDQMLQAAIQMELDRPKLKKETPIPQVADRTPFRKARKERQRRDRLGPRPRPQGTSHARGRFRS